MNPLGRLLSIFGKADVQAPVLQPSRPGRQRRAPMDPAATKPAPARNFHSVSIIYSLECCAAASDLHNTRFLSNAAPTLPLTNCSRPQDCACRFKKHTDRRAIDDRRIVFNNYGIALYRNAERRVRNGRRTNER